MGLIATTSFDSDGEKPCLACQAPKLHKFNWAAAAEPDQGGQAGTHYDELRLVRRALQPGDALKIGRLYTCEQCQRAWWLDAAEQFVHAIPAQRLELIKRWNAADLTPSSAIRSVLDQIGGLSADYYGNWSDFLRFPARAITTDGREIDPVIVVLLRRPPLDAFWHASLLLNEIAELHPSEYALPLDVRQAALDAQEVRMSFTPTRVEATNGARFVLNGALSVLRMVGLNDDVAGSMIRLPSRTWSDDAGAKLVNFEHEHNIATAFFGDSIDM